MTKVHAAAESVVTRLVAIVQQAGEAGIETHALQAALGCTLKGANQARYRARQEGVELYSAYLGDQGGCRYFARVEWRDAAAAAQAAAAKERARAYSIAYSKARREALRQDPERLEAERERWRQNARKAAAKRPKPARKPKPAAKPKAGPKLHALGTHMPALNADGTRLSPHQATCHRPMKQTVSATPVDYSRAVYTRAETPRGRFDPTGPVPSVIDPTQCRPWAMAAAWGAA